MNLIDIYTQEVTRRLPEKSRDDIALELRSTIEDMLPDEYSEEDLKDALSKLGDPVTLASKYRDRPQYLIGPLFFERYVSTLKMVLPIATLIVLLSFIIGSIIDFQGETTILEFSASVLGEGIWVVLSTGIQVLFWVTLVFFILERTGVSADTLTRTGKKWEPNDLKNIPMIPQKKKISKGEVFVSLLWTGIWAAVYFNAIDLIGVYEKVGQDGRLELVTPIFNKELLLSFWPVVIGFICFEIALAIIKYVSGQWTMKLAVINAIYQVLICGFFIFIAIQPDLLNSGFVEYLSGKFDKTTAYFETLVTNIIRLSIVISVIASVIDVVVGFRKARLQN